MTKNTGKFWWAVAAAVVAELIGRVFHKSVILGSFAWLWDHLMVPITIPAIVVAGALLLLLVALVGWIKREVVAAATPEWYAYRTDQILGVRWRWGYDEEWRVDTFRVIPFCPKCDYQLRPELVNNYYDANGVKLTCGHCGFETPDLKMLPSELDERAIKTIELRIRNGDWRSALPAPT